MKMGSRRESELDSLKLLWGEIRGHLEERKRILDDEIRNYPTPIPHCDAQFNHLAEQRTRLWQDLERMNILDRVGIGPSEYVEVIEEFIKSSPYTSDESELTIRSRLKAMRLELG